MADPGGGLGLAVLAIRNIKEGSIVKTKNRVIGILVFIAWISAVSTGYAARVKDIATIGGVRDNQLVGYGLVAGLAGTGDDVKNGFTRESLSNMLSAQGLAMKDNKNLKADNSAAVMITAVLPPFAKIGSKVDVMVSSIGDATSLQGGTLLMTPLRGVDGKIYAVAQGPIVLGGYSTGGSGASVAKNHTSVGRIGNGAIVERELSFDFEKNRSVTINLMQPDFTTARRLAEVVGQVSGHADIHLVDSCSVQVNLKDGFSGSLTELVSIIENMNVPVDAQAVVVLNEKTGTVVMGENVRISTVAIAHGNLSIQIKEESMVSQPAPFAPPPPRGSAPYRDKDSGTIVAPGGQTVVTKDTTVGVAEENKQLMVVPQGVTIQEVVQALNAIGVTPRDLISILQTIKAAGALQAELRVI